MRHQSICNKILIARSLKNPDSLCTFSFLGFCIIASEFLMKSSTQLLMHFRDSGWWLARVLLTSQHTAVDFLLSVSPRQVPSTYTVLTAPRSPNVWLSSWLCVQRALEEPCRASACRCYGKYVFIHSVWWSEYQSNEGMWLLIHLLNVCKRQPNMWTVIYVHLVPNFCQGHVW